MQTGNDGGPSTTWLGRGTLLLASRDGKRVLVDPWLEGNPKTPDEFRNIGDGGTTRIVDLKLTMVSADHSSGITVGEGA